MMLAVPLERVVTVEGITRRRSAVQLPKALASMMTTPSGRLASSSSLHS